MALSTINPTTTAAWKALESHYTSTKNNTLKAQFAANPKRAQEFTIAWKDFYVDYSKNRIDATTKSLLLDLARQTGLEEAISHYFGGATINQNS